MKGEGKYLAVVDLDGTLITGNSLHEYIKAGLAVAIRRGRLCKAMCIALLMAKRALRLASHADMKFGCAGIIGADPEVMARLKRRTAKMMSHVVAQAIREYEGRGCDTLIATAAFDFYVPYIADYPFVATRCAGNSTREELRGERKAKAVEEYARRHGYAGVAIAITDSLEDEPLLLLAEKRMIVKNGRAL